MRILGIETSCDETGISVVEAKAPRSLGKLGISASTPQFKILSNAVSSQIKVHRPFGGVVPMLAKREHIKNLPIVLEEALKAAKTKPEKIDLIAVTVGPGLEPALWTGVLFAKELSKRWKKPLIGVNHLEAHLYSSLIAGKKIPLPAIALIVSGGHTILLLLKNFKTWKKIGETKDDAVGEAFDKVARMLKLSYPGGPEIQKLALQGKVDAIQFPRPMMHTKDYDFSFSGLKTALFYYTRDTKKYKKADVAASFQQAALDVLVFKTIKAARAYGVQSIILSGGVAANTALRESLGKTARTSGFHFFVPDFIYNTDNGAMIAVAGYLSYLFKKKRRITAQANLSL